MKKGFFFLLLSSLVLNITAQTAADLYKKAETAYTAKDFITAATSFADALRAEGDAAAIFRYRSVAAAFAQAGIADSAFHYLTLISKSNKTNRVVASNIENGYEFNSLQTDKRWKIIIAAILKKAEAMVMCRKNLFTAAKMVLH
jgi:hypothetical protein